MFFYRVDKLNLDSIRTSKNLDKSSKLAPIDNRNFSRRLGLFVEGRAIFARVRFPQL
ncbi:hypothetical protein RhiirA5_442892 [Rhizophagus irregularis]|uniref:Uncharacterized protein n=1 Tax=Rhizophagus irregularis TaxID=588596 RepID=A0A2N0NED6_9GLOM|nr:hypothetical protein RhiirA5_442892 [Rhizophagus irregularis]